MRKRELVAAIAAEVGLANDQVRAVLDSAFGHIADELLESGRLEIRSLGVFNVLTQKERQQFVPKTGQTITIPARRPVEPINRRGAPNELRLGAEFRTWSSWRGADPPPSAAASR